MGVLRRGQRVEVSLRGRWQLGLVEDSRTVLVGADALEEHCVRFDSGCEWLCMQRTDYRLVGEEMPDEICAMNSVELPLRCCVSQQRLVRPACGSQCQHPPNANYKELVEYVMRHKRCPLFGCNAQILRRHSVVVHTELEKFIASVPSNTETVYLSEGRPHLEPPSEAAAVIDAEAVADAPAAEAAGLQRKERFGDSWVVPRQREPSERTRSRTEAAFGATSTRKRSYSRQVLGERVSLLWLGDGPESWYTGTIKDYSESSGKHLVRYDDGDSKWHFLDIEEAIGQLHWLAAVDAKPQRAPSSVCASSAEKRATKRRAKQNHTPAAPPSAGGGESGAAPEVEDSSVAHGGDGPPDHLHQLQQRPIQPPIQHAIQPPIQRPRMRMWQPNPADDAGNW